MMRWLVAFTFFASMTSIGNAKTEAIKIEIMSAKSKIPLDSRRQMLARIDSVLERVPHEHKDRLRLQMYQRFFETVTSVSEEILPPAISQKPKYVKQIKSKKNRTTIGARRPII